MDFLYQGKYYFSFKTLHNKHGTQELYTRSWLRSNRNREHYWKGQFRVNLASFQGPTCIHSPVSADSNRMSQMPVQNTGKNNHQWSSLLQHHAQWGQRFVYNLVLTCGSKSPKDRINTLLNLTLVWTETNTLSSRHSCALWSPAQLLCFSFVLASNAAWTSCCKSKNELHLHCKQGCQLFSHSGVSSVVAEQQQTRQN